VTKVYQLGFLLSSRLRSTFVPVSAVTAAFVTALAGGSKRTALAARIARLEQIPKPKPSRVRVVRVPSIAQAKASAKKELDAIDQRVASYAKNYSPELANFFQERDDELAQGIGKFFYQLAHPTREAATTFERTRARSVALTQSINSWIYATRKKDNLEQDDLIKDVGKLYDTSTEPDPPLPAKTLKPKAARQAREKNAEAKKKKDGAKKALLKIRDTLALTPEDTADPPKLEELEDLEIATELLVWCTTYNFALVHEAIMSPTSHGERWKLGERVHAPQLPGNLWKQFKDRYTDTLHKVLTFGWRVQFEGFEVTMSKYFEYLRSNLSQENAELIRKFSNLRPAKPRRP
jgi:hypothetical protein